jgi:demethylmenaquinone methyltransferase/2-methoxy-6-polyprenyl-1,4-benzoquinol methylase/phosphoethanolamine N-methyltransferase
MHANKPEHEKPVETTGRVIDGWAGLYDRLVTTLLTPGRETALRKKILDLAAVQPGEAVLEIGCGTGSLAIAARQRMGPAGKVYGIDPSEQMLAVARGKAARAELQVDFQPGVVESLDFPDDSFDAVLSSLMVHHLPDDLKQAGMAECLRVLKPGGRLVIVDIEPATLSMLTLLHGYLHHRGKPEVQSKYQAYMELAGFDGIETGKTGVKSLIYLVGKKPAAG